MPAPSPVAPGPQPDLALDQDVVERLRAVVPRVAAEAVETIMRGVPSYARPFSDVMGARIRTGVELALVNFLELARLGSGADASEPIAPNTSAAYELGRGEARSGRSMDALQAAMATFKARGLDHMQVNFAPDNPEAAGFWTNFGFRPLLCEAYLALDEAP